MMKRKIELYLQEWKQNPEHNPLIVRMNECFVCRSKNTVI